ncbi:SRPBCC family protein [Nocardioides sp. C4-1]|uniref:SRPBCC family protein n=1 Tax=Nocardioides sp. C4-1 TaxID=3151851 RepID=UPI0032665F22
MPVVARTLTVEASIASVWQFVSDFTTTEEWDPPTVSTARTSGDGGLGSTYRNVMKFHGSRTEVDYVMTERDPEHVAAWRGTARGLVVLTRISLSALPGGLVEVRYESRLTPVDEEVTPLDLDEVEALVDLAAESLLDSLEHLPVDH